MRVLVDTPAYFIRPKNTDWRYMKSLRSMSRFVDIDFVYPKDLMSIFRENASYVRETMARRLASGHRITKALTRPIGERLVEEIKPDVIFSHSILPIPSNGTPVVWLHGTLDPKMLTNAGWTSAEIERDRQEKGKAYSKADIVILGGEGQLQRHRRHYPLLAGRFDWAPFYLSGIDMIESGKMYAKHSDDDRISILFVGREARRKGLDLLVGAIRMLPLSEQRRFSLAVVSDMSDGAVKLDLDCDVRWYKYLDRLNVLALMRSSHVFAMPSRFESYGFTFIEAMASGCALVAPAWEIQHDLLSNGASGINVTPEVSEVRDALLKLKDRKLRMQMAQHGLDRFKSVHSERVVAERYAEIFDLARSGEHT
jgi:glycosyltransferase involved in cell wall biosynthesis